MSSIALALLKRYLPQIILAVAVITGYFAWAHHLQSVQHEKDMAAAERATKVLLQRKIIEVKIENDALHERKDDAIQIYAKHSADIERDAGNLIDRMSKRSGSCRNAMPRKVDNDSAAESRDTQEDRSAAVEIISTLNMCEFWINQIPVK